MLKNLWPKLVKGAIGFLIGVGFWWAFSVSYGRLIAALSEPLTRVTERPPVTRLIPEGTEMSGL